MMCRHRPRPVGHPNRTRSVSPNFAEIFHELFAPSYILRPSRFQRMVRLFMTVVAFVFIGAGFRVNQKYEFYLDYELTEEELAQVGSSLLPFILFLRVGLFSGCDFSVAPRRDDSGHSRFYTFWVHALWLWHSQASVAPVEEGDWREVTRRCGNNIYPGRHRPTMLVYPQELKCGPV